MSGLLCAGDLYIDRFDEDGNPTGLRQVGNATRFEINEPSESVQRGSNMRDSYGQLLSDVAIKQPSTIGITLDDINKDNLAMALLGDTEAVDITAGSVTDEEVLGYPGGRTALANTNLDPEGTITVTDDGGTPTEFTEGADYEVDHRLGHIIVLEGGGISAGDTLLVSYDFLARTGSKVSGGVRPQIRAKLVLDGRNLDNGKPIHVTVFEASLRPDGAVDFLSSEFVQLTMTGNLKLVDGMDAPYIVDMLS